MDSFELFKNYKIKIGEPNFLIGLCGNGISTDIQKWIYSHDPRNVYYLNYVNADDLDESYVIFDIVNCFYKSINGVGLSRDAYKKDSDLEELFNQLLRVCKEKVHEDLELLVIIDEFYRIKHFSSTFYSVLLKIFSISRILPKIKITSILVSDEYFNPTSKSLGFGLSQFCYHYCNYDFIRPYHLKDLIAPTKVLNGKLTEEILKKINKYCGGNPSLILSLSEILSEDLQADMKLLMGSNNLIWRLDEIWKNLTPEVQVVLLKFRKFKTQEIDQFILKFLINVGILNIDGKTFRMKLLEEYVEKFHPDSVGKNYSLISLGGIDINLNNLQPQLAKILVLLFENKGNLISKDDIAKVI